MTTDKTIIDEKLQYGINIEAGKIWVLLSGNIDKCEYLIGDEILLFNQIYIFSSRRSFLNKTNWISRTKNK